MIRTPFGFLFIILITIALLWGVGIAIYIIRLRRARRKLADGPVCGACGYAASVGELTRCPECGGDYAEVGIVGPRTRSFNPAVILSAGIGWVFAVAIFGLIATLSLGQVLSVTPWRATVNTQKTWLGPSASLELDLQTDSYTVPNRPSLDRSQATIRLHKDGQLAGTIEVDDATGTITKSDVPEVPAGKPLDAQAAAALGAVAAANFSESLRAGVARDVASALQSRTVAKAVPGVSRSSSSSGSNIRGNLSTSTGTSTTTSPGEPRIALGSILLHPAVYACLMAAVFLVIATIGLLYLARIGRATKSPPKPAGA